jgi:hypothetical protein
MVNQKAGRSWELLTKHALVLLIVFEHPDSTIRDISASLGVTEKTTQGIARDLVDDGIISRVKQGRSYHYQIDLKMVMERQTQSRYLVRDIVIRMARLEESIYGKGDGASASDGAGGPETAPGDGESAAD